jgi:hypothetical protein
MPFEVSHLILFARLFILLFPKYLYSQISIFYKSKPFHNLEGREFSLKRVKDHYVSSSKTFSVVD